MSAGPQRRSNTSRGRGADGDSRSATPPAPALDYPLIGILATLLALGLVMVYSASVIQVGAQFFLSQILWIVLGTGVLIAMACIPFRLWQSLAIPVMAVALLALAAVLIFGDDRFGARRTLFNGRVQPSEFAKLAVVIYVAAWVASKGKKLTEVEGGLVPFSILMGLVTALIVLEPSFSVAIITLAIGVVIFFVGGADIRQLLIAAIVAAVVLAVLLLQSHYGVDRIHGWWATLSDPSQASYQTSQAMQILRRGDGIGTTPDNWLEKANVPLLWSDYLFANIGHDLRFPGTVGVVALYAALGYRGLGIALKASDRFGALMAIGITTWILSQAAIHMGASLALIPTTGQPLPFMSYGGSAMLSCMAAMGLLLSIARASTDKKAAYARFALGGRDGGPRLPDSGRGERPEDAKPTAREGYATAGSKKTDPDRKDAESRRSVKRKPAPRLEQSIERKRLERRG